MPVRLFGIRLALEGDDKVERGLQRVGERGNRSLRRIDEAAPGRPARR